MNFIKCGLILGGASMLISCGGGGETTESVVEVNSEPKAIIQAFTDEIYNGDEIYIDGSKSFDPDLDKLDYKWEIIQQPQYSDIKILNNNDFLSFVVHEYGVYEIALTVNDGKMDSNLETIKFEVLDKDTKLICNTYEIDKLEINTENQNSILKETYINSVIKINNGDIATLSSEIRGRGNSTWGAVKKPYRLKLNKNSKYGFSGMQQHRNWAMLANYFDGTMLRNAAALCLGRNFIRNSWTPDYRFVDLTLNGKNQGLYQITEHVEVDSNKVDLVDNDTEKNESGDAFFIEMTPTSRLNNEDVFIKSNRGNNYEVKSDLNKDINYQAQQLSSIKKFIDDMEKSIYSKKMQGVDGFENYIDTDSAIDYILLNELFKDNDRFWASTHFHKPKNGKIVFGPIWDYDLSSGGYVCNNNQLVEGWWILTRNFPSQMLSDENFKLKLVERWNVLNKKIPNLINYIEVERKNIESSQDINLNIWGMKSSAHSCNTSSPPLILGYTHDEQVSYLKKWLTDRAAWMDVNFKNGNF